ncbi:hypothetical protein SCAB_88051 [Streptomyces scabiei 87.22]|uniref:Uncharacterized protein n=1 Tax=Streptomyces scabiei (strain 87.22) TaxID=680198 RepID=C9Z672_STRSW|nr:hypothetical protein [Streptomyces sp. LBUM 1481]MBP5934007.1 hypothetical protein [Streptomyces sp. LBUM 1479]CBG75742.1 hypothetical protein SCAB_88051 [Streptomyces scabiei 87.22]
MPYAHPWDTHVLKSRAWVRQVGAARHPPTRVADGQTRDRRGSATPVHVEAENLGTAYVRRRSTTSCP